MTRDEFSGYLVFIAIAFAVIGLVNLLRPNKRWIGLGSILWAVAAVLYRQHLDMLVVAVPCALALFCIGLQARQASQEKAS